MEKIKGLLYCCKAKPLLSMVEYLYGDEFKTKYECISNTKAGNKYLEQMGLGEILNGKIVAECDFDVEEHKETTNDWLCMSLREKIVFDNLCKKANIDELECYKYANGKPLYALHISNLKIFDKPRELYDCLIHPKIEPRYYGCEHLSKTPQNMMYVELDDIKYTLISIQPQELCRILNGEQTIVVRKKVLNCMKGNE